MWMIRLNGCSNIQSFFTFSAVALLWSFSQKYAFSSQEAVRFNFHLGKTTPLPLNRKSGQVQVLWIEGYWCIAEILWIQEIKISLAQWGHDSSMTWNWWSKKEHRSLHRSCRQWVRDTGYSPGAQEIKHKSVSQPDGSSSSLPSQKEGRKWDIMKPAGGRHPWGRWKQTGKSKVQFDYKILYQFLAPCYRCNSKGNLDCICNLIKTYELKNSL